MSETLKAYIGAQVRAAREQRGWSQQELADRTGKDLDSVSLIERGRTLPPLKTLLALRDALEVPLAELVPEGAALASKSKHRMRIEAEISQLLQQAPDKTLDEVRDVIAVLVQRSRR